MKKTLKIEKNIRYFFFLSIFIFVFFFQSSYQVLNALSMENYKDRLITEELRLKVPSSYKDVWLEAEKNIWEPWLSDQEGFIDRKIFWDKNKEEALILVNWQNRELWKKISLEEVNEIQAKFEDNVKKSLNISENPFNLIYEGELLYIQ